MISRGASFGFYGGPLRDCVVALKYHGRHKAAKRLAVRLLENGRCREILERADLIVAVPLHPDRLRHRGFNQAGLIAAALGEAGPGFVSHCLVRTRNTRSQTDLGARERRLNVLNAFSVQPDPALQSATVVLVDDVITTGATLRECGATLLAHGAREVRSITVARAE